MPVKQWVFVGCMLGVCWGKVSLRGASCMYRLTQVLIHDEGQATGEASIPLSPDMGINFINFNFSVNSAGHTIQRS